MTIDLKPCPFCGNVPTLVYSIKEVKGKDATIINPMIFCDCGIELRPHSAYINTPEALAEIWNRRA